jgi:hypothetical protein
VEPGTVGTDGLTVLAEPVLAEPVLSSPLLDAEPVLVGPDASVTGGVPDDDGPDKQAAYAAWAERMRTHKKSKLADLAPTIEEGAARPPLSPYWDSSTLFSTADDDAPTDPALMATRDLLAVLELSEDADVSDLQGAFRRLAKEHHPDRWHDAPPDVRGEHESRMALITEAHRELRRRGL